jgi:hypothetical protein
MVVASKREETHPKNWNELIIHRIFAPEKKKYKHLNFKLLHL